MIEIQIIILETQYFSCCLLHFTYLGIYLKQTKTKTKSKTNKQTKQNKTKKKKKRNKGKRRFLAEYEPSTFGLTRTLIATTPLKMNA